MGYLQLCNEFVCAVLFHEVSKHRQHTSPFVEAVSAGSVKMNARKPFWCVDIAVNSRLQKLVDVFRVV